MQRLLQTYLQNNDDDNNEEDYYDGNNIDNYNSSDDDNQDTWTWHSQTTHLCLGCVRCVESEAPLWTPLEAPFVRCEEITYLEGKPASTVSEFTDET